LVMPRGRRGETVLDFTKSIRELCIDICSKLPELYHVKVERIAFGTIDAKKRSHAGLQARITPMRFANGATTSVKGGRTYRIEKLIVDGVEALYLMEFAMPRFFVRKTFEEKLAIVIHELYHISPSFDGDLRRFGKNTFHAEGKEAFHQRMRDLTATYLANDPDFSKSEFLKLETMKSLRFLAWKFRRPKLIPLDPSPS
jgi:predicted metallopeptidase